MNVRAVTFLAASSILLGGGRPPTPEEKSQAEFERIALTAAPAVGDAAVCTQTQAALLAMATPEDLPVMAFREGYCELAEAAITGDAAVFRAAAADFDRATEKWAARAARRKPPAEPAPSILRALAQIARLEAVGGDVNLDRADRDLGSALDAAGCPASLMPASLCQALAGVGRQWQGWIALEQNELGAAARHFSAAGSTAWGAWVEGRQAFGQGRYSQAVDAYGRAIADWEAKRRQSPRLLLDRVAPPMDLGSAYCELGGTRLLAGDAAGAIGTLRLAMKESPANARAMFLRARAEEAAGQTEAALADYNLASRTAFANAADLASGEAHLYRGILFYRRKEYRRAEEEFMSALNFAIAAHMRADAVAWRRLSAVTGGSCDTGRRDLEEALPAASPYFPRQEARDAMAACEAGAR